MRWPKYDHVIFDFDSTLTEIEGIDVLADRAGVGDAVSELTRQAMDGHIKLESVYEKRLAAIRPTRGEIRVLREEYKRRLTEDAESVIGVLLQLGHEVYIVSGGLLDPIVEIGASLGIPKQHIKAVDVEYDEFSGEWWRAQADEYSQRNKLFLRSDDAALEKTQQGKAKVIRGLLTNTRGRSLLIGDGTSDMAASGAVNLFMGYSGVVARERVLAGAPVVLCSKSLAPVIVVAAGFAIEDKLNLPHQLELYGKALHLVEKDSLRFNDQELEKAFRLAYGARSAGPGEIF